MGEALEKARAAKDASRRISMLGSAERAQVICAMAHHLRAHGPAILAANAVDVADARAAGVAASLVDRLMLDEGRVEAMARGLEEVAAQPDPLGRTLEGSVLSNGL